MRNPNITPQDPHEQDAMNLRDYFAIRILQANYSSREQWTASMKDRGNKDPYAYVCEEAYNLADEMLKQRIK